MQSDDLEGALKKVLQRPDLSVMAEGLTIKLDPNLKIALSLEQNDHSTVLKIGGASPRFLVLAPTLIRYGIELSYLLKAGISPILASFVSARVAAQFHMLDVAVSCPLPLFLSPFITAHPNEKALLQRVADLCAFLPSITIPKEHERQDAFRTVITLWSFLAPIETFMSEGRDPRLSIDVQTGLNQYACSYRPRPWAISFGSSTASSLSERSFSNVEEKRRAMMQAFLSSSPSSVVQKHCLLSVRERIADHMNLLANQVIINSSGPGCELSALSLVTTRTSRPISALLVAPDETGCDLSLAAQGRHFSSGSARSNDILKGSLIEGFPNDITLIPIPIRTPEGTLRSRKEIDSDCHRIALEEIAKGHHVLLHRLDQSQIGMVAPSIHIVEGLMQELGDHISVIVNACQARVSPERMTQWVQKGMMVMLTGSKFLTGPPFCGALLLPTTLQQQLRHAVLPAGLSHYSHRSEWPDDACQNALSEGFDLGLAFRWKATLAEMDALFTHPNDTIRLRLEQFMSFVEGKLKKTSHIHLLPSPSLGKDPLWDGIPTILSFLVDDPRDRKKPLSFEDMCRLHTWLNADLSPWISEPHEEPELLCFLGAPVSIPHEKSNVPVGALRFCAGARLVSDEDSDVENSNAQRVEQERRDVQRVIKKILLILRYWYILLEANPIPRYAPLSQP